MLQFFVAGGATVVLYLVVVLYIMLLPARGKYFYVLAILSTILLIAGYLFLIFPVDRSVYAFSGSLIAIFSVWIAIYFTSRYRRFLEKELRDKERLNAMFENATEGMLITNASGEIVLVNKYAEQLFGYQRDELLGEKVERIIPARFNSHHVKYREGYNQDPHNRPMGAGKELFALHKNQSEFPVEVSLGHFKTKEGLFIIAFIIDITDRKRAAEQLKLEQERTRKLNEELEGRVKERTQELEDAMRELETINRSLQHEIAERKAVEKMLVSSQQIYNAMAHYFPEGVIGVISRDRTFKFIDGRELSNLGLSSADLTGESISSKKAAILLPRAEALLKDAFSGLSLSVEETVDGRIYSIVAVPLPDEQKQIEDILIVIQNITPRKHMEEDLRQSLEKERELGDLKSRFVTTASHEFRTPLSTILSSVFLLENYRGERFEQDKDMHLQRIRRSVNNMTAILNDFLSLSKLEEGKVGVTFTEFDLQTFTSELISEMELVKKSGQNFRYVHSGETAVIATDKQLLKNILINLISNAIKFSNEDGKIEVLTKTGHNEVTLQVTDWGVGIPDSEKKHIFNRFFRARNVMNIEGTGLGLNIVRKYAELLNGTVSFESEPETGTRFTVVIPSFIKTESFIDILNFPKA